MVSDKPFHEIDKDALDEEWVAQPAYFAKYAKRLADKRAEIDAQKAKVDVIEAEIDRDIRKDPAAFGIAKITEDVIKRTIVLQVRHFNALAKLNELKHEAGVLSAVVEALDHRKRSLENLVTLWCQEYWSEPRAPKGAARDMTDKAEKRSIRRKGMKEKN